MVYIKLFVIVFTSALVFSCDDVNNVIDPKTDPLIDAETAAAQNYNLTTPFYNMQVAVDSRVDRGDEGVLNLLDNRAADFLDCQFPQGGAQLGFETVEIEGGEMVPPLSELRVYVVPNRFECEAVGASTCAGIYFGSRDIIVVSEGGFFGCGEFGIWKHELGHRYGMEPDHSNRFMFESCIDDDDCDLSSIVGIDIGG